MKKALGIDDFTGSGQDDTSSLIFTEGRGVLMAKYGMSEADAGALLRLVRDIIDETNSYDAHVATVTWNAARRANVPDGFYILGDERTGRPRLMMCSEKYLSAFEPEHVIRRINMELVFGGYIGVPEVPLDDIVAELFDDVRVEVPEVLDGVSQSLAEVLNAAEDGGMESLELASDLQSKKKKYKVATPREEVGLLMDEEMDSDIDHCVHLLYEYVSQHRGQLDIVCREIYVMNSFYNPFLIQHVDPARRAIYTDISNRLTQAHAIEVYEYILPTFKQKILMKLLSMTGRYSFPTVDGSEGDLT